VSLDTKIDVIRHGLFSQDDISEKNSTEYRRDLNFGGLRPEPMAECIVRLKEIASQTLKVQITATGLYRYRLERTVHAFLLRNLLICD
jgi:hypothetical protein